MLYKKFNSIKTAINDCNYSLARSLLSKINKKDLAPEAKELYHYLEKKFPSSVTKNISTEFNFNKLSLHDNSENTLPGISIVSCCMNRNKNLAKSLETWLELDVDEIIIVDWSSSTPVSESIKHFSDNRIKILRVDGEEKWVLTYGFNIGLRFANYSKIYKFDADISVQPNFLELNNFTKGQFVRGFWKLAIDQGLDSQVYVNGSFGAYKEDLKEIGYYNELIRTYGWDDSDLYERLASQRGLQTKYLAFNSLVHLEQKEEERTIHQKIINEDFLGIIKSTEFNNHRNRFIGRNTDYWNVNRLQDYSIEKKNSDLYQLKRISESISIAPYIIEDAENYASLHYLWHRKPNIISKASNQIALAKFIFKEYQERVNFLITEKLLTGKIYFFDDKSTSYIDFIKDKQLIAQQENKNIYTVTLGERFSHKRIGIYGKYVEMLIVPLDLAKELAHIQSNLGFNINLNSLVDISYQEFMNTFDSLHEPVVYVDAQHGLGNRLRAIGSAAAIAKSVQRELVIVWQADHHCECEFSDLFNYDGKVITQTLVNDAHQYMDVFNYMEIEDGACKDAEIVINNEKDLYLRAAYTFVHEASHWEAENEFIKALIPSKQVLDLIEPFNVSGHIAAHIRMEAGAGLDHNTYDSVENWTQEGHDQLHYWREKSHYSAFIKRIDQLIAQDDSLKLFVATDLQETYDIFEKYYGDRLVFLRREVFDRSKEQIIYALADVLLLSQCQKLLGSTWSSFSEAAMRLSNTYSEIEMSGRDF